MKGNDVAHYNIDEQGCTLVSQFRVPSGQSKTAGELQGHIYGFMPDAKTVHSHDKSGDIILKTTLKIEEPSIAEIEHFYHQMDVIAAMVFIKPAPTQEDMETGQETVDMTEADPRDPALTAGEDDGTTDALDDGDLMPGLPSGDGQEDQSGDPNFDTGDSNELEPDDLPDADANDAFYNRTTAHGANGDNDE